MNDTSARDANIDIYNSSWTEWEDMKEIGPASRWHRWLVDNLLKKTALSGINRILDFGCGTGITTSFIASLFPQADVQGCDISESGVSLAKKRFQRPGLSFVQDDGARILCQDFDLICCFEVLEHVQDWQSLLWQFVRSGRHLLLSFPTGRMRSFETGVGHVRNFAKGEIEAFLKTASVLPMQSYYAGFPFYSPIYRDLCQVFNVGPGGFARGKYGVTRKTISWVLYSLFRYASMRSRGDQFCGLFSTR